MSNTLDPDQDQKSQAEDRHSVGADLRPNCLQRLSADDKVCIGNLFIQFREIS